MDLIDQPVKPKIIVFIIIVSVYVHRAPVTFFFLTQNLLEPQLTQLKLVYD